MEKHAQLSTLVHIIQDGKYLMMHRVKKKNDVNEGKWIGVGGKLEPGETPGACLKREVLEETGCRIKIIDKLGIAEEYKSQSNFKQVSNVFLGQVIEDTKKLSITQKEKDEGAKLLWETPKRALELIIDCYDKLIKSDYESVYSTKFVVVRDRKILEYYIDKYYK